LSARRRKAPVALLSFAFLPQRFRLLPALLPAVLLADEPTSHQFAGWRDSVWRVVVEASETGAACLSATREPEIARYATRVWEVSEGVASVG
jgi:putative ABC transport system ATP-binding protein